MLLSVMIPSVPARLDKAAALYGRLVVLAARHPVEILMLTDNKKRSIGAKRQALVQAAIGDYIAFVDDDDDVAGSYFANILGAIMDENPPADVISFPTFCSINSNPPVRCEHSIHFRNEEYNPQGFRRTPWMCHAWSRSFVAEACAVFENTNYGEDAPWVKRLIEADPLEVILECEPLYHYRFNAKTTEAK